MADNKTTNTLLNAELPASADNAIKNLTDKPSLTVGTILSDLIDLTFGQVSFWAEKARIARNYKLEQFREKLLTSASKIPPEKLVEPSIQITAQALEDSKYCISEDALQDMFVSLISNSMNTDFANCIHPSFSGIIKQMSTLDAKIIALFKSDELSVLPVCQYRLKLPAAAGTKSFPEHIFLEIPDSDIFTASISLSSLLRFGLVTISYYEHLTDEALYKKFSTHPFYIGLQANWPIGDVSVQKGVIRLTPLGRSFVNACVPD